MKWFLPLLVVLPLVACNNGGFFDGSWDLQENGCSPFVDFAATVTLHKTGSTIIDNELFDLYRMTAPFEADNFAMIGQDTGRFLLCLDPLQTIDPNDCVQLCDGDAMDDEITFSCEVGVAGHCEPVRYGRIP